jgi:ribosomal subunit interface protein
MMWIEIRALGFALTDAIRAHADSRLAAALRPFTGGVVRVTARLEDVNADRGGVDKRCAVVAHLRGRETVVADAVHEDLYAAIDHAADRARRAVRRLLARRIARERKDPQRPGALVAP